MVDDLKIVAKQMMSTPAGQSRDSPTGTGGAELALITESETQ
jgi:hypothetical protein